MFRLHPFQTSLETIRAHHWRHFGDVYAGCQFNCQFCLYKGPGDYGAKVTPQSVESFQPVSSDRLGIVDIGAMSDPYQPAELQNRVMRQLLQRLLAAETATFVLTRGTLVTRDIDILREMAGSGLVEVCFSIITERDSVNRAIEPSAPAPSERLRAAEHLRDAGIPVSFHLAPLVPGLDSPDALESLVRRMAAAGGMHVFVALLGARSGFWGPFTAALEQVKDQFHSWEQFQERYPARELASNSATTCHFDEVRMLMDGLRDVAVASRMGLVSENFPAVTTGPLDGGIYRWKLPTVYDMWRWISEQGESVSWPLFLEGFYAKYQPPLALQEVVKHHWDDGELFVGVPLEARPTSEGLSYGSAESIASFPSRTMVARRV